MLTEAKGHNMSDWAKKKASNPNSGQWQAANKQSLVDFLFDLILYVPSIIFQL